MNIRKKEKREKLNKKERKKFSFHHKVLKNPQKEKNSERKGQQKRARETKIIFPTENVNGDKRENIKIKTKMKQNNHSLLLPKKKKKMPCRLPGNF